MDIRERRGSRLPRRRGALPSLLAALAALGALAQPACRSAVPAQSSRSVQRVADAQRDASPATFDPAQSAGLFVGVRRFANDSELAEVRYAVDDAADLAFTLALD